MIKITFLCVFLLTVLSTLYVYGDKMGGKGKWIFHYIRECPGDEQYKINVYVTKTKINRTYEVYNANFVLLEVLDDNIPMRAEICKFVDGNQCKPYQVMSDDSVVRFLKKYAEENLNRALEMLGLSELRMEKGNYTMKGFGMDMCELPSDLVYGNYIVIVYLYKNGVKVACLEIKLDFAPLDDEWCGEDP